jgi:hypothetical protein
MAVLIFALDTAGLVTGTTYGLILGGVNLVILAVLVFGVDRGLLIRGAGTHHNVITAGRED